MKRFSKILVFITDPKADSDMTRKAVQIAQYSMGSLTLMRVLDELPEDIITRLQDDFKIDLPRIIYDQTKWKLQKLIDSHSQSKISISQKIVRGEEFLELMREIGKGKYQLVMAKAEKEETLEEQFFGTTQFQLLRKCPCPVWIYPPKKGVSFDRIMVSIDTSTRIEEEKRLNTTLLEIALGMAKNENAALHILHCWKGYLESNLGEGLGNLSEKDIEDYNQKIRKEAWKNFEDFLIPFRSLMKENQNHFLMADPAEAIPRMANEHKIELLVMGTLGRSGIKGYFIGNTAESILNQVNCSVLAVKPDGIISPVKV